MPLAVAALVITGAWGRIVISNERLPVPLPLDAEIVDAKSPDCVGVPLIIPVEESTDIPAGRPTAPKLVGARLAVI